MSAAVYAALTLMHLLAVAQQGVEMAALQMLLVVCLMESAKQAITLVLLLSLLRSSTVAATDAVLMAAKAALKERAVPEAGMRILMRTGRALALQPTTMEAGNHSQCFSQIGYTPCRKQRQLCVYRQRCGDGCAGKCSRGNLCLFRFSVVCELVRVRSCAITNTIVLVNLQSQAQQGALVEPLLQGYTQQEEHGSHMEGTPQLYGPDVRPSGAGVCVCTSAQMVTKCLFVVVICAESELLLLCKPTFWMQSSE